MPKSSNISGATEFYCDIHHPEECAIKKKLGILADKWNLSILTLFHLRENEWKVDSANKKRVREKSVVEKKAEDISLSFNQLKKELHSISSKVLAEKLNLLLKENYLNKKEFLLGKMKRTLYSLTEKGKRTKEVLMFIQKK